MAELIVSKSALAIEDILFALINGFTQRYSTSRIPSQIRALESFNATHRSYHCEFISPRGKQAQQALKILLARHIC